MFASAFRTIRVLAASAACVSALGFAAVAEAAPGDAANLKLPRPATNMADFVGMVLQDVDAYWDQYGNSNVNYNVIPEGASVPTGCTRGGPANDRTFAYCPADDTIYVGEVELTQIGNKYGDFGVATGLAHEYAHNVEFELGMYDSYSGSAKPFELLADCMAGMWANNANSRGLLDVGDAQEGADISYGAGDFETSDPEHHGTPEERNNAFVFGYSNASCSDYVI